MHLTHKPQLVFTIWNFSHELIKKQQSWVEAS